jgi:hypothetical protein
MISAKRVAIATILGVVFGFVCMYLATANPNATEPVTTAMKWTIVVSRGLIGFMIGISALNLKWYLHGILLGAIGSIPMAAATMDRPMIALSSGLMGIVYGFLIELITSVLFKAKSTAVK